MNELATLLLQRRLISRAQLEEALDSQILNGGRLGTNLVELGQVTERQLADALQAVSGVPALHGEIVPTEAALQVIKPEWCNRHNLMPLRIEGRRLYIGLLTPYSPVELGRLAERLGMEVSQLIIPEFRMNQLLRRYAKAFRPVRPVDLTHAAALDEARATATAPAADELMSEEAFAQLYAQALSGGRHSSLAAANAEHARAAGEPPEPSPLQGIRPASSPARPAASPLDRAIEAAMAPLTFAQAQAALADIHDRDGVAQVVLRFAAGKFERALLFTLHGEVATGWCGAGGALAGAGARRVAVHLAAGSPFKLVRDSRAHFLGPVKADASTAAFFKAAGGAPLTALLMPILARGRVINILYADGGPKVPTVPDIGELMILSQRVGRAYEDVLARNKRERLAAIGG